MIGEKSTCLCTLFKKTPIKVLAVKFENFPIVLQSSFVYPVRMIKNCPWIFSLLIFGNINGDIYP